MSNALEIRYSGVVAAPLSHWAARIPSSPFPAFTGNAQVDVAVVGAGYLGLWTALLLKRKAPHLKIAILEAQRIADGPSGRNGGMAEGFWGRLPLLEATFGTEAALDIAAAGEECAGAIRSLARAYPGVEAEDGPLGFLASHDWQRDALATKFSAIERLTDARHAARADSQALADLFPSARFVDGILYPTAFTVQPAALVRALAIEAEKSGVDIYERSPVLLARLGDE
ncbi:MAG: NAD(P)/FAD-dependent oxidoreductase, partial [Mesorhizobium sp.]